ncbi:DUF3613 domain-containing protein [Variovorax paradoxus]|uniref:DUF3613 domain-containing protein n=1 Tax=Variovorax paradoxus TaxID=34073 RepID=A0A0H2LYI6_VARPD|nr:DUF3613 domain-containing protein [Variovorax paradoxus]KLN54856.1 hypothetical protein VPARA_41610 [Variovorax paradoxus]
MNHESTERIASLPVRAALTTALLFMATSAFAQTNAIKSDEAKAIATPVAAPTDKIAATAAPAGQPVQNQTAPEPQEAQVAESEEFDSPPLLLGDATQNLLAWQRSGEIASPTPRPIAGSVASRSYERYIKSFEHPIPERLSSTVTKSSGGGGSSSGSR